MQQVILFFSLSEALRSIFPLIDVEVSEMIQEPVLLEHTKPSVGLSFHAPCYYREASIACDAIAAGGHESPVTFDSAFFYRFFGKMENSQLVMRLANALLLDLFFEPLSVYTDLFRARLRDSCRQETIVLRGACASGCGRQLSISHVSQPLTPQAADSMANDMFTHYRSSSSRRQGITSLHIVFILSSEFSDPRDLKGYLTREFHVVSIPQFASGNEPFTPGELKIHYIQLPKISCSSSGRVYPDLLLLFSTLVSLSPDVPPGIYRHSDPGIRRICRVYDEMRGIRVYRKMPVQQQRTAAPAEGI